MKSTAITCYRAIRDFLPRGLTFKLVITILLLAPLLTVLSWRHFDYSNFQNPKYIRLQLGVNHHRNIRRRNNKAEERRSVIQNRNDADDADGDDDDDGDGNDNKIRLNFTKKSVHRFKPEKSCYNYYSHSEAMAKIVASNGTMEWFKSKLMKPSDELEELGCDRRLPKAFIIGVKKCGTTTLTKFMDLHPQLEYETEKMFNPFRKRNPDTVDDFVSKMPLSREDQITLLDHPGFYHFPKTLKYVVDYVIPDVKFILVLRDPVKRAISDYSHVSDLINKTIHKPESNRERFISRRYDEKAGKNITVYKFYQVADSFEETITDNHGNVNSSHQFIKAGIYIDIIEKLVQYIDLNSILVIDGDLFTKNPLPALKKVQQFLGLPCFFMKKHFYLDPEKGFYCANVIGRPDFSCMSSVKGRPHPDIDPMILQKLSDFYRPYNLKLKDYLNLKPALSFT